MSARDELLAAFADIQCLGALIDGEDTDEAARANFTKAHQAAWATARRAARRYFDEHGGESSRAPAGADTLERRRAKVAADFKAGVEHMFRVLASAPPSSPRSTLKASEVDAWASSYAVGKVAK